MVEQYLRTEVLLTESIYHGKVPDDAKGKYFNYIVSEHEERTDTYSVKYCGQAISPSMSNFVAFYLIYQQYKCALGPLRQYLQFSQGAKVVVHLELFEARMAIENEC